MNNERINIHSIESCCNIKTKKKTLILNNKYILNQRSTIIYKCDKCNQYFTVNFKFREKYFFDEIFCKTCNQKETFLKNYGNTSYFASKEGKTKIQKIKENKYNNKFYTNREKAKQTNIEKYGVEHYTNREKAKQTNMENYGVEYNWQRKDVKEKIKKTNLKKYGVKHHLQNSNILEKQKQTNLQKYGFIHPMKNNIIATKMSKTLSTNKKNSFINNLFKSNLNVDPVFKKKEYISSLEHYQWKCKNCGKVFYDNLAMGSRPRCPACFPKFTGYSLLEKEIVDWLKSLDIEVKENDRELIKPKELDIYLPDYNLAIEFNGLYWHSTIYITDRWHHQNKIELCYRKGVRLLYIWEDEWLCNQNRVKKKILYYMRNMCLYIKIQKPILIKKNEYLIWY